MQTELCEKVESKKENRKYAEREYMCIMKLGKERTEKAHDCRVHKSKPARVK